MREDSKVNSEPEFRLRVGIALSCGRLCEKTAKPILSLNSGSELASGCLWQVVREDREVNSEPEFRLRVGIGLSCGRLCETTAKSILSLNSGSELASGCLVAGCLKRQRSQF